jgi:t-SNARE complex subunit (syntaxin)
MEDKSHNMKDTAFTMKNNAKQLEREARKRNCRLWCILIIIGVALLIQIIVPIVIKSKKSL